MQYITTTELRTKSKGLVEELKAGKSVELVHRSRVIGEIKPKIYDPKPFDPDKFGKSVQRLNFPKLSIRQIEAKYRAAMTKKHGKSFP